MWTPYELEKIGEIYEKLPKEHLEDYLPPDVLEAIMDERGKAYENLGYVPDNFSRFEMLFKKYLLCA